MLPSWVDYDEASRIFRGKVPEEEYKIICAFELVGSIKPGG